MSIELGHEGQDPQKQADYHLRCLFTSEQASAEDKLQAVQALEDLMHQHGIACIDYSYELEFMEIFSQRSDDKIFQEYARLAGSIAAIRWPESIMLNNAAGWEIQKKELGNFAVEGFLAGLTWVLEHTDVDRNSDSIVELVEDIPEALAMPYLDQQPALSKAGINFLIAWLRPAGVGEMDVAEQIQAEEKRAVEIQDLLSADTRNLLLKLMVDPKINLVATLQLYFAQCSMICAFTTLSKFSRFKEQCFFSYSDILEEEKSSQISWFRLQQAGEVANLALNNIYRQANSLDKTKAQVSLWADEIREKGFRPIELLRKIVQEDNCSVVILDENSVGGKVADYLSQLELQNLFSHIGVYVSPTMWPAFEQVLAGDPLKNLGTIAGLDAYIELGAAALDGIALLQRLYQTGEFSFVPIAPADSQLKGDLREDAVRNAVQNIFSSNPNATILVPAVFPHCSNIRRHGIRSNVAVLDSLAAWMPENRLVKTIEIVDAELVQFGERGGAADLFIELNTFADVLRAEGIVASFGQELPESVIHSLPHPSYREGVTYGSAHDAMIVLLDRDGGAFERSRPTSDTGVDDGVLV